MKQRSSLRILAATGRLLLKTFVDLVKIIIESGRDAERTQEQIAVNRDACILNARARNRIGHGATAANTG